MFFLQVSVFLLTVSCVDSYVYLYNTEAEAESKVEFYDCVWSNSLLYCRRPDQPIVLGRDIASSTCFHNGTKHSFKSLKQKDTPIGTILHKWKSSIEKAEAYSQYQQDKREHSIPEEENYLCECTMEGSFGKNCEYMLPVGNTFRETNDWVRAMKKTDPSQMQIFGDIVCYVTLKCNSGLLCLDWRDLCDGLQQCMFGYDEENCDMLEFNECEDDEYRCANGMCIPDEFFLDGEYDCSDLSDEKAIFNDSDCNFENTKFNCDDRSCPRYYWSCGDGQCIVDRFAFQKEPSSPPAECNSRRDQYYMCETHKSERQWTLSSGKCSLNMTDQEISNENRTISESCSEFIKCMLYKTGENCSFWDYNQYSNQSMHPCPCTYGQYPSGALLAPYVSSWYDITRNWTRRIPDYITINGSLKCHGYTIKSSQWNPYSTDFRLLDWQHRLCVPKPHGIESSTDGYEESCYRNSSTFNNHSYHFYDGCSTSRECISAYRVHDGVDDCLDKQDENSSSLVSKTCSNVRRHRFRCSRDQDSCLIVTQLNNITKYCWNYLNDLSMVMRQQIPNLICRPESKDDCNVLRQYIELSNSDQSINSSNVSKPLDRIPFRAFCDTFWNLKAMEDENIHECQQSWTCLKTQWRCHTGQCIERGWVLDGEWDCADASDEEALYYYPDTSPSNSSEFLSDDYLHWKYDRLKQTWPFYNICNFSTEYACFRNDVSDPLNIKMNRPCIPLNRIGDGKVDCVGGLDERSYAKHCWLASTLGYYFHCPSEDSCFEFTSHCESDTRCKNDSVQCFYHMTESCQQEKLFRCLNGTCIHKFQRCNGNRDCTYGEDEYMCIAPTSLPFTPNTTYRMEKETLTRGMKQELYFTSFTMNMHDNSEKSSEFKSGPNKSAAFWCNRGIGVFLHDASIVCFCPPQYYGDKCQIHSDRVTVLLQLNLTQSVYERATNDKIMLKIFVIFLHEDQILMSDSFDVRPAEKDTIYKKTMAHLLYSRSNQSLDYKRTRRLNRSDIILSHPYSIRIEAYERVKQKRPELVAVWLYPIYFDFLPVFHLAKILPLMKFTTENNPCWNNPCVQPKICHPNLSGKPPYLCLCPSDFDGKDFSIINTICNSSFCSSDALCKPNYRGVLSGDKRPLCICPLDRVGPRCLFTEHVCHTEPCENGGTCQLASELHNFFCVCGEQYKGRRCEQTKTSVYLDIIENILYQAAVVQYFYINIYSLVLHLAHQEFHEQLPQDLTYFHDRSKAPEIIIIKRYFDRKAHIHLVSLQLEAETINASIYLNESNHCVPVETLLEVINESSPILYHSLCNNDPNLLCFTDQFYLCVCDHDHNRVECFGYNHTLDACSSCFAGGRCIQAQPNEDFFCLCPFCHSGKICQFNSESFSFTLDQLFSTNLANAGQVGEQATLLAVLFAVWTIFMFGLLNNTCSFLTFRRSKCRGTGIGFYLLVMSMVNQISLGLLACRLTYLVWSPTSDSDYLFPLFTCKVLNYLLNTSSHISYWLVALIALERAYITLFFQGQWLNKPIIAKRLVTMLFIVVLGMGSYELVFTRSYNNATINKRTMCGLRFPDGTQIWTRIHQMVTIIHVVVPFFINFFCTTIITYITTKKKITVSAQNAYTVTIGSSEKERDRHHDKNAAKIDANKHTAQTKSMEKTSRLRVLFDVLQANKELIIGPAITLIPQLFSFPLLIISIAFACRPIESSTLRYYLILFYFISFVPQMITFFLYISPSSFYTQQWHATRMSKWLHRFKCWSTPGVPATGTIFSTAKYVTGYPETKVK